MRVRRDRPCATPHAPDGGPARSGDRSEATAGIGKVANIFEPTFFERLAAVPPG